VRYDGGPEEGSADVSPSQAWVTESQAFPRLARQASAVQANGRRYDGGLEEGTRARSPECPRRPTATTAAPRKARPAPLTSPMRTAAPLRAVPTIAGALTTTALTIARPLYRMHRQLPITDELRPV
jgi:hypothetical protein